MGIIALWESQPGGLSSRGGAGITDAWASKLKRYQSWKVYLFEWLNKYHSWLVYRPEEVQES